MAISSTPINHTLAEAAEITQDKTYTDASPQHLYTRTWQETESKHYHSSRAGEREPEFAQRESALRVPACARERERERDPSLGHCPSLGSFASFVSYFCYIETNFHLSPASAAE